MVKTHSVKIVAICAMVLLAGLYGCKKEPGKGGLATIKGKVFAYDMNQLGDLVDSGYIADQRVYISYGDHTWIDDDVRTGYNGEYAFEWLQKGDYTIWVLGECDTCNVGQRIDKITVTIDQRKETLEVPDLVTYFY
jgi:hypothetical protein